MQNSKSFTSEKFDWLNRVAADPALSNLAFRVAYAIAQHVNERSRVAWPSYETIATAIGSSRRGVIKSIKELESLGHIRVKRHSGRTHTNQFEMVNNGSPFTLIKVNSKSIKGEQSDHLKGEQNNTQNTLDNTLGNTRTQTRQKRSSNILEAVERLQKIAASGVKVPPPRAF